jgi:CRISPR/Cas system-associated endoribonuclease Cas2
MFAEVDVKSCGIQKKLLDGYQVPKYKRGYPMNLIYWTSPRVSKRKLSSKPSLLDISTASEAQVVQYSSFSGHLHRSLSSSCPVYLLYWTSPSLPKLKLSSKPSLLDIYTAAEAQVVQYSSFSGHLPHNLSASFQIDGLIRTSRLWKKRKLAECRGDSDNSRMEEEKVGRMRA